jgi:hypothetical protein
MAPCPLCMGFYLSHIMRKGARVGKETLFGVRD